MKSFYREVHGRKKGDNMFEVKVLSKDNLSEKEKEDFYIGEWDYPLFIKVIYDGEVILMESDRMEPEDANFGRDLSWISGMLEKCYEFGMKDGYDTAELELGEIDSWRNRLRR